MMRCLRSVFRTLMPVSIAMASSAVAAGVNSFAAPLGDLEKRALEAFLHQQAIEGRKVCLLTSGGTSVPLEKRTVRSIVNFSTGARGSALAEAFLRENGYAVVFLHRDGSLLPFIHAAHEAVDKKNKDAALAVTATALDEYRRHTSAGSNKLLLLPYATVHEYLRALKTCCESVEKASGSQAMVVLAAAVSDFYIPEEELSEHKIQSRSSHGAPAASGSASKGDSSEEAPAGLELKLKPVPKQLGAITKDWCPSAFVVSFKLETDPDLLFKKATQALETYGVHAVVANLLDKRYSEISVIAKQQTHDKGKGDPEGKAIAAAVGAPGISRKVHLVPAATSGAGSGGSLKSSGGVYRVTDLIVSDAGKRVAPADAAAANGVTGGGVKSWPDEWTPALERALAKELAAMHAARGGTA